MHRFTRILEAQEPMPSNEEIILRTQYFIVEVYNVRTDGGIGIDIRVKAPNEIEGNMKLDDAEDYLRKKGYLTQTDTSSDDN